MRLQLKSQVRTCEFRGFLPHLETHPFEPLQVSAPRGGAHFARVRAAERLAGFVTRAAKPTRQPFKRRPHSIFASEDVDWRFDNLVDADSETALQRIASPERARGNHEERCPGIRAPDTER